MKQRRKLRFQSYDEVILDIENLQTNGYEKLGNWELGQICRHLSYYHRGALEGFPKMMPWIIRVTLGKWMLKRLLVDRSREPGRMTDPKSVFNPDPNEKIYIREAIQLLTRLKDISYPLYPSAMFGKLTYEEWKIINLDHCSHHLSFLIPL